MWASISTGLTAATAGSEACVPELNSRTHHYHLCVLAPSLGDDWLGLGNEPLPVGNAHDWAVLPRCGAVVVFTGTVRDHAEHRTDVTELEYEAYDTQVLPRLASIAADARTRWPDLGRIALLHRVGALALTEVSVVVAVSAPHRAEAFAAARFCIDALKTTVPIWKRETWSGGTDWGTCAHDVGDVRDVAAHSDPAALRRSS
jgi:molybdopterin synthase catalytic subunit